MFSFSVVSIVVNCLFNRPTHPTRNPFPDNATPEAAASCQEVAASGGGGGAWVSAWVSRYIRACENVCVISYGMCMCVATVAVELGVPLVSARKQHVLGSEGENGTRMQFMIPSSINAFNFYF